MIDSSLAWKAVNAMGNESGKEDETNLDNYIQTQSTTNLDISTHAKPQLDGYVFFGTSPFSACFRTIEKV